MLRCKLSFSLFSEFPLQPLLCSDKVEKEKPNSKECQVTSRRRADKDKGKIFSLWKYAGWYIKFGRAVILPDSLALSSRLPTYLKVWREYLHTSYQKKKKKKRNTQALKILDEEFYAKIYYMAVLERNSKSFKKAGGN